MTLPAGGVWWYERYPAVPRDWACRGGCHCRFCGRLMVETVEYHRWHSCPKFLPSPWWVNLLTLGFAAFGHMGHCSHDADNPLLMREWR